MEKDEMGKKQEWKSIIDKSYITDVYPLFRGNPASLQPGLFVRRFVPPSHFLDLLEASSRLYK